MHSYAANALRYELFLKQSNTDATFDLHAISTLIRSPWLNGQGFLYIHSTKAY